MDLPDQKDTEAFIDGWREAIDIVGELLEKESCDCWTCMGAPYEGVKCDKVVRLERVAELYFQYRSKDG